MRIHVLQVAYGDTEPVAERVERVAELVRRQRGADVVVLPELWAHGGFAYTEWSKRAEPVDGPVVQALSAAAREIGASVHVGSIVARARSSAHASAPGDRSRGMSNTAVLLRSDGGVESVYRKIHRFGFGEGEPALLEAGTEVVTAVVAGRTGHGEAAPVTVGLATCYDLRFPELFRHLVDAGSELFVVPAAWPASRVEHWKLLGRARAVENQCFVVQCNTAGTHSGVTMGGHSQIVSPTGAVLAEAGDDEECIWADIDLAEMTSYRAAFPVLDDRRL
ncbi:carbon-nitrogen family hydrolase [Streptomyces sp. NPDC086766]|uniref:carbon-nitrogen family hydrolase n=1 Tax=Streptomyces sp. NPDC086766 TaxID=3365754 RepID=UPI00380BE8F2